MQKYIIGLDVGGTKIAAGTVDSHGRIIKKIVLPTEARRGRKTILKNILIAANKVWLPGVKSIGIAIAGQCDFKRGIFISGPNLPKNFRNLNLKKFLQNNFRAAVYLDNDARAFTLAEATFGAGRGKKNVIGITLGTGIGSGIVIDRKILRGKDNAAGEIGHMTIEASSKFRCGCGKFGHFEALASGTALQNFYKKLSGKSLTGPKIIKLLTKDKNARGAVALVSKYLGVGLANLAQIFNPDIIVIGGGLSGVSAFWPAALQEFKKRVIYKSLKNTPLVKTMLGDNAGIIGATLLK